MKEHTIASQAAAITFALVAIAFRPAVVSTQHQNGPGSALHNAPQHGVDPFDRTKGSLHFRLHEDGATIELSAIDPTDEVTRQMARVHLSRTSVAFSEGDFSAMRAGHAPAAQPTHLGLTTASGHHATGDMSTLFVPGVATLTRLARSVKYAYVETPRGGRIDVTTTSPEALTGLHEFLRFQINQHGTGDAGTVVKR